MPRPRTEAQKQYQKNRKAQREARRDELARLRVENPEASDAWLAEQLGVSMRTLKRDIKALEAEQPAEEPQGVEAQLQQFMDRMEARFAEREREIEARYEAKIQELEAEKQSLEVDKDELERQAAERADDEIADLDAHFQKILNESEWVEVISDKDEVLQWQGFSCQVKAHKPTKVRSVFVGVLKEAQRARAEAARISNRYKMR